MLPCFFIPSARIARFFNRKDVIAQIEEHFQNSHHNSPLGSLALYGMGGVGKSQIAMKHVETRQKRKELDAVFWFNAENPVSMQQSFTEVAIKLKLPGTGPATHDENRLILKGLLQRTGMPTVSRVKNDADDKQNVSG